jgi:hypothetical protein
MMNWLGFTSRFYVVNNSIATLGWEFDSSAGTLRIAAQQLQQHHFRFTLFALLAKVLLPKLDKGLR